MELRQAIAAKLSRDNGIQADPTTDIVVTGGATGAFTAALMGLSVLSTLPHPEDWVGLSIIGLAESERHGGEHVSIEQRYYIAALPSDARQFGQAVRHHWGIENSLHWVLDVTLCEDECRIRCGEAAENLCTVRHFALHQTKTGRLGRQVPC
jgi:Transposase DDE domain